MKVAFITGASRGIGAATVKKFVEMGWQVAGFYSQNKMEDETNVKYYQMDIASSESIKEAFAKAYADFGQVDSLVNCAGVFNFKKDLLDYTDDDIDKIIAINEKGMYITTKVIMDYLKVGSIVHISSISGQKGSSSDPIYAGTKGAVLAFVKSMATRLAPNIRVNCVAPGPTDTHMMRRHDPERVEKLKDMILLKRLGRPEEIANAIFFLASEEASFITGATLDVNGGMVLR
ncbi:SDR family oxidoreductase [Candidatus Amesbacteria bacterium]|nr:SDR family oxidoreductase [Candidatus Amesbacteria bacterium]